MQNNTIKLPINVYEGNMGDKKCDYKTLAIMTLYSNRKPHDEDTNEQYRFIYRNKVIEFTNEIEQLSKNKMNTVLRNIKKLSNLTGNLVNASRNDEGKILYTINYRDGKIIYNDEGKPIKIDKGSFVIVEEDILKFLVNVGNSEDIKVYLLIKALCEWNERINGNKEKWITNSFICEHIGLSSNSKSNLQTISDITYILERIHLINKRKVHTNTDGILTCKNYYSVVDYEEWKRLVDEDKHKNKVVDGRKN